jgi:hypothetical protein
VSSGEVSELVSLRGLCLLYSVHVCIHPYIKATEGPGPSDACSID